MKSSNGYGPNLDAITMQSLLAPVFEKNERMNLDGKTGTPICIWGTHGLGKTQMVQEYARQKNWKLAYCAPAQFEEMGDLHGMPIVIDPTPDQPNSGDERTVFAPPDWVPKDEGPGILLLDDINRADDRILRGIMQLLQNFAMFSWEMPPRWQIVATANPEGASYSVTPMDNAMLTRMLHFTLIFDAKVWAKWAHRAKVDPRGIAFVLNYPEAVTGQRTTPRTLVQFFEQIEEIEDLKSSIEKVANLAGSVLDETTVAAFINFVHDELTGLLNPEDILDAKSTKDWEKKFRELSEGKVGGKRIDRISAICTRLILHITAEGYKPKDIHLKNFSSFLLHKNIPNDLRASIMLDLSSSSSASAKGFLKDKNLARKLIQKL